MYWLFIIVVVLILFMFIVGNKEPHMKSDSQFPKETEQDPSIQVYTPTASKSPGLKRPWVEREEKNFERLNQIFDDVAGEFMRSEEILRQFHENRKK